MNSDTIVSVYTSTLDGKPYTKAVGFRNRTEMADYFRDVQHLKDMAANIAWRSLDVNDRRDQIQVFQWHQQCVAVFGSRWGLHRLPMDIRIQVNACEVKYFGTLPSDFGEDYGNFQITTSEST